jgi:hypothetical protein
MPLVFKPPDSEFFALRPPGRPSPSVTATVQPMLGASTSLVGALLIVASCGPSAGVANEPTSSQNVEESAMSATAEEEQAGDDEQQPEDAEERIRAEVVDTSIKLDLPTVPEFIVPMAHADGSHSVAEMRLNGKPYLTQEIRIKGTVLWIYDCAEAMRRPGMSAREVKKVLAAHPERCTRPHFTLGEASAPSPERGIQVVEQPRPVRKDERRALDVEMVAEMDALFAAMPAFKVGDEVMVTGVWSLTSPRGFQNTDGLLSYGSMVNLSRPSAK